MAYLALIAAVCVGTSAAACCLWLLAHMAEDRFDIDWPDED